MTTSAHFVTIYGYSDDLVEFEDAVYGESPLGKKERSKITLRAPDGTTMSLVAEFCGEENPDGWTVRVIDNPGNWDSWPFQSRDDEPDWGIKVRVPQGTKAKCDGKKVR